MSAADSFTKNRLRWLEQVQDDPSVSTSGFALAFAIARHLNRQRGCAFPSQQRLAHLVHKGARQVRALLTELERRGHLTIESGGFQKSNRYTPILKSSDTASRPDVSSEALAKEDARRRPEVVAERHCSGVQTGARRPPNPMMEPFELEKNTPSIPQIASSPFEQWWAIYPWKTEQAAARKLFDKIVEAGKATPIELVEGAARYARSETVQRGYPKNPKTWLAGECWRDAQDPTARHALRAGHGETRPSALAWIIGEME